MATTSTPLRYPGGKSRLARFLSFVLRTNRTSGGTFVEPFAGGAGAAINLLRKEYVQALYLNDIDRGVYAFWYSVLHHTEQLCHRVAEVPLTMSEWHHQRAVVSSAGSASLLDLGFAVLFMNRTNRSGIIQGGVIGGQRQLGKWRMDARFNRSGLVEKIRRVGSYRQRIELFCMDATDFLRDIVIPRSERVFVFADPPYYRKSKELYENHYEHEDHVRFAETLRMMSDRAWVACYDDVPEIREIYGGLPSVSYKINYSAARRYDGQEVMFFGPSVARPDFRDPLGVERYA